MTKEVTSVPSISVSYAQTGASARANALGMRPMQERAYEKRGEQYLLIKSPPASGKSRALMFIALDKLQNQGLTQAIIVVPEKAIGASFKDEPLSQFGFWADWRVEPKWNLCDAPGGENGGKVKAVGTFLASADKVLVCTHATFRFAVDEYGVKAFDNRLIVVDEFHHVSANPDNKLGTHLGQFMARDKAHIVAMTGSYFRGDAEAEARLANAKLDPTFLLADVEVVATYELYNVNRAKLEKVIHRVFGPSQLDIEIKDRFGNPVKPREWFLVPLSVVDEVVTRIKDGTITQYVYDPTAARLSLRSSPGEPLK